jgi:hypothetical protein
MANIIDIPALRAHKISYFRKRQIEYEKNLEDENEELKYKKELYDKSIEASKQIQEEAEKGKNQLFITDSDEKCKDMHKFVKLMNSKDIFPYELMMDEYKNKAGKYYHECNMYFKW